MPIEDDRIRQYLHRKKLQIKIEGRPDIQGRKDKRLLGQRTDI